MAPRLREVPRAEVTEKVILRTYDLLFGDRDPVAEPGTATGTKGDWWTAFANSPDVFDHAVRGFGLYRNPARKIDPVLRELGQTRIGWANASQFVFSQHCKSLRGLKVSEEKIAAIPHWQVADCYDDKERTVLAYTERRVPVEATPGSQIHLSAAATDNVGIASVDFSADGTPIATVPAAPYESTFIVPPTAVPGAMLTFTARASDFAANGR